MSHLESLLENQFKLCKLTGYQREYRFAMEHVGGGKGIRDRLKDAGLKDWRFDFVFLDKKLAVEVEGGIYVNGRHNRGKGFEEDLKKYHEAMKLGFDVYRVGEKLIKSGEAVQMVEYILRGKHG